MVLSYVMSKQIKITENLIRKLIGFEGQGVTGVSDGRIDMARVCNEIFTYGIPSTKIRDLKPHYKIWAKIILGYIHNKNPTNSPDYINADQRFLL